jgi:hypothetical protein
MSQFYFDVYEGDRVTVDNDGMQLVSADAAWLEAARSIAEMARDAFPTRAKGTGHSLAIAVRDESGPAFSITASFETDQKS